MIRYSVVKTGIIQYGWRCVSCGTIAYSGHSAGLEIDYVTVVIFASKPSQNHS